MDRCDAGHDIIMKHTNINIGDAKMPETDQERKDRTGLSSLQITDEESKAVQKTAYRVSLESMEAKIAKKEFIHPETMPHMTIAVITLENGWALVGKSAPADPENFNAELGEKFAYEDAVRQMWQLEGYLLRERLML